MIGVLRPKRPLSSAGKEHGRFPTDGLIVRAGSAAAQRYRANSSCPTTSGNKSNEDYTKQLQKYEEGGAICGSSLGENVVMRLLPTVVRRIYADKRYLCDSYLARFVVVGYTPP